MRVTRQYDWMFILVLAFGCLTCNETLPPFENPVNVIRSGVLRARYVLVQGDNSMEITITVRHSYDETLEGATSLEGSLTITLPRLQSVARTIRFDYTNLSTTQKYNVATRNLRFDPGDTLIFKVRWDFVDDAGDSLTNTVFRYYADPSCRLRCIADEEIFSMSSRLTLFDDVPPVFYGPVRFSVCHVTNWIDGAYCEPINPAFPCSYFPSARVPCDSLTD